MFLGSFRPGDRFPQSGIGHVHLKLSEVSPIRYRSSHGLAQAGAHPSIEPAGQPDSRQSSGLPGPLPSILARFLARTRPAGDRMSEMGAEGAMVRSRLPQHEKPREIPSGTGNPGSDRPASGRDSAQVSITVRPSCPGMAQMALCHRIGQPKPLPASGRDSAQVSITWVFDLELSTLLGESRPGHYLFRTVDS